MVCEYPPNMLARKSIEKRLNKGCYIFCFALLKSGVGIHLRRRQQQKTSFTFRGASYARLPPPPGLSCVATEQQDLKQALLYASEFFQVPQMAAGQNQWCHFGVGAPPILVYFSGDWDAHWGYGVLTPWPSGTPRNIEQEGRRVKVDLTSHYCGWTESISHHFEARRNHGLLVFTGESSETKAGLGSARLEQEPVPQKRSSMVQTRNLCAGSFGGYPWDHPRQAAFPELFVPSRAHLCFKTSWTVD